MVNLEEYFKKKLAETSRKPEPIVESQESEVIVEETFYRNVHGFDIFVDNGTFYFRDNGNKYVSRNILKLEDKALELSDASKPLDEEPEIFEPIKITNVAPGKYDFESPWGKGEIVIDINGDKEKIRIEQGSNIFFGEAKRGSYFDNFERIRDLIRTNLEPEIIDEAETFRKWSDISGLTAYEETFRKK